MHLEPHQIPRCPKLDGSTLRIVPAYTEAGEFGEANCITIADGERTVVYVPHAVAGSFLPQSDLNDHLVDASLTVEMS